MKKAFSIIFVLLISFANARAYSVAMTGDIMMGTAIPSPYYPPEDGRLLFKDAAATLRSADLAVGNLEGTLCDTEGQPRPCHNPKTCFLFRMPQKYVNNLVHAGFDAVNIATNHINDVGKEGRDSTMATLRSARIAFTGLRGICETRIIKKDGKTTGLCSCCHSNNSVSISDIPYVVSLVKELKRRCDYVIVSFHGGAEGAAHTHVTREVEHFLGEDRGNIYALAHACIDAGADLVFGHGPHVPRALELYKGHLIAYSLGNFCTPYRMNLNGVCGYAPLLIAELDADGLFVKGRIESYIQHGAGAGPVRDKKERAARLMEKLSAEDFPESKLVFNGNIIMPGR